MHDDVRLQSLSEFLKTHRAKLQPNEVGLPSVCRRRTPGVRREEVAQLAGISTTWYTWLEQGRNISVTTQVLERIALALKLNEEERKYLFMLALHSPAPLTEVNHSPVITPAIKLILNELRNFPMLISDRRCNIVGWNQAAAAIFIDFAQIPANERNMIWLLFTRREFKALAVNWRDFVRGFLALFRSYYRKYMGDTWYKNFIEKLNNENPEFQSFWSHNDVSSAPEVFIEFRHAKAGKMLFDLTSLEVKRDADLRFSVFTPSDSNTEMKVRRLVHKLNQENPNPYIPEM
jgi:transcriptional regulator with XRE-family HTH domain